MILLPRQKGSRRLGLSVEFPLVDSQGFSVIHDRRQLPDRRREKYDLKDFKEMLTKMAGY